MATPDYKPAALFDLEGTLSNNNHRQQFLPADDLPPEQATLAWDDYYKMLPYDAAFPQVIKYCNSLPAQGIRVVITTGVPNKFRGMVKQWLAQHRVKFRQILMRRDDDHSPNAVLKQGMLRLTATRFGYTPIIAVDDLAKSLKMYHRHGVPQCYLIKRGRLQKFTG